MGCRLYGASIREIRRRIGLLEDMVLPGKIVVVRYGPEGYRVEGAVLGEEEFRRYRETLPKNVRLIIFRDLELREDGSATLSITTVGV